MKDGFCPRSQNHSGPEQRLSKSPKELSRAPSIVPLPCKRKTSRKWEETWGLAPAPRAWLPVPSMNVAFCALSYLSGLPSNHFFLGDASRSLLRARARMAKLPQGLLGGWREEGRARGAQDARCSPLLLRRHLRSALQGPSLVPNPELSRLAAAGGRGLGPGVGAGPG